MIAPNENAAALTESNDGVARERASVPDATGESSAPPTAAEPPARAMLSYDERRGFYTDNQYTADVAPEWPVWRLGVDPIYDEEQDQREDVS